MSSKSATLGIALLISLAGLLAACASTSGQATTADPAGTSGTGPDEAADRNPCAGQQSHTPKGGPASVSPGADASWLLDPAERRLSWMPNHYEQATGNSAAVVNYGMGLLFVTAKDGVEGYISLQDGGSANALWMDLDGSSHFWVLRSDGMLLHGSIEQTLASELQDGPKLEGSFVDGDAAGQTVALASTEALLVLENGEVVESTLPVEGFRIDRLMVRSDDLIVAQGTGPDRAGTQIWLSDDAGRSWRRSAFQTSAVKQFGSLVSNTRIDDCRVALADNGKTWIRIESDSWPIPDGLSSWSVLTTWDRNARWQEPLELANDNNPPAPAVSAGKPVKGSEEDVCKGTGEYPGGDRIGMGVVGTKGRGGSCSGFACAGLTGPAPVHAETQFGIISDGICGDIDEEDGTCRDIVRNHSFAAWVTLDGAVDLVAPPVECPVMLETHDARGAAFLACQNDQPPYDTNRIFMRMRDDEAWEGLMTFHLGEHSRWGVTQAADGTIGLHNICTTETGGSKELCAIYILDPVERTWRELEPEGLVLYRTTPDAGALLLKEGPEPETWRLILDQPGFWGDQRVLTEKLVLPEGHSGDLRIDEDGTVLVETRDADLNEHVWTIGPDGALRAR